MGVYPGKRMIGDARNLRMFGTFFPVNSNDHSHRAVFAHCSPPQMSALDIPVNFILLCYVALLKREKVKAFFVVLNFVFIINR